MAWPPSVLDDFTGSDGSINGRVIGAYTWVAPFFTGNAAATIVSNALAGNNTQDREGALTTAIGPDVQVAVTIPAGTWVPGGAGDLTMTLFARVQGTPPLNPATATFYDIKTNSITGDNDSILVRVIVAGTTSVVLEQDIGTEWGAGDAFGAELVEEGGGTRIRVYRKPSAGAWSELGNVLDTTVGRPTTAGLVGLALYNPALGFTMDDFSMADLEAPVPGAGDNPPIGISGRGAGW